MDDEALAGLPECDDEWEEFVAPFDMSVRAFASAPSPETIIAFALDDAVASQTLANQQAARQMFAIREAFAIAQENPRIYVPVGASEHAPGVDDVDFATRSVAFDLAQRLHMSENLVRDLARQAQVLSLSLPRLRSLFEAGRISQQHVRAAVDASEGLPDASSYRAYDERSATIADSVRPSEFARRCRVLRERLCVDSLQERHDDARRRRRVVVEMAQDAMAWMHLYAPVVEIARAEARLTAEARRLHGTKGERRTLDQLRADVLLQWMMGDGSLSASVVEPFVLVGDDGRFAELLGYGPLPPKAVGRALRDAPAFRKVLAEPGRPAVLTLDTTRYRPTPDQKRWLTLRYGLDDDSAPYLSSGVIAGAEIDHVVEWQHGGVTDVENLVPLKPRLHRLKSVTRIRLDPKPGGGIRVRTPTGFDSDPPPF
jgi:hypothetical protein